MKLREAGSILHAGMIEGYHSLRRDRVIWRCVRVASWLSRPAPPPTRLAKSLVHLSSNLYATDVAPSGFVQRRCCFHTSETYHYAIHTGQRTYRHFEGKYQPALQPYSQLGGGLTAHVSVSSYSLRSLAHCRSWSVQK